MQTTVTSKGQVVIPQAVRQQMLLDKGSKLDVSARDGESIQGPTLGLDSQALHAGQ